MLVVLSTWLHQPPQRSAPAGCSLVAATSAAWTAVFASTPVLPRPGGRLSRWSCWRVRPHAREEQRTERLVRIAHVRTERVAGGCTRPEIYGMNRDQARKATVARRFLRRRTLLPRCAGGFHWLVLLRRISKKDSIPSLRWCRRADDIVHSG